MRHKEFLDFDEEKDWFFKNYYDKMSFRYWTQKIALGLFLQMGGDNMVETGCARQQEDWGGGYSTYLYGVFAKRYNKNLWTCDIDEYNLEMAKEITHAEKDNITYVCDDSVHFLKWFDKEVNFLYLDSVDCAPDNEEQTKLSQEHQLRELETIMPKLSKKCIVLLDDNNYPGGGKTKSSKEYLEKTDFFHIMDFQQSLWARFS